MPFLGHALKRNECALPFPLPLLTGQYANMMAGAGAVTLKPRDSDILTMAEILHQLRTAYLWTTV